MVIGNSYPLPQSLSLSPSHQRIDYQIEIAKPGYAADQFAEFDVEMISYFSP